MLHDILDDDHIQVAPSIDKILHKIFNPVTILDLITEFDFLPNCLFEMVHLLLMKLN